MYSNKLSDGFRAKPSAMSLASNANIATYLASAKVIVKRIAFQVKTTLSSSGATVISVYKRPTPGSASGQTLLGTISIPTGAVAPNVYYKDISGVSFQPGDELAFDVTTAATSAGDGYAVIEEVEENPEVATNLTNHVASA